MRMRPAIFWPWRSNGSRNKAVPGGTRQQVHLGVCETLLDRRPLPPLRDERLASPLDEGRTPRIRCGGVSGNWSLEAALRTAALDPENSAQTAGIIALFCL